MINAKILILLCCVYHSIASHSHTIPVDEYETKLQVLGQHVEIPETPVKVIKITKTIAVKVPVPYPVKVVQKVPYPVHISKPYPVPVPQIVKVPHVVHIPGGHQPVRDEASSHPAVQSYSVQDGSPEDHSFNTGNSYGGANAADGHSPVSLVSNSYGAPAQNYYGYGGGAGGNDDNTFESKSYDDALKEYFDSKQQAGGNNFGEGTNQYH